MDVNGRPFENQGQCVAAAVRGRLGQDRNAQVTGTFTGTESFEFGAGGCSVLFQVFDATYTTQGGPGSFHVEGCISVGETSFLFTGTFTLTTPTGATLAGTASGVVKATAGELELTLTVTTANGALAGATGTLGVVGLLTSPGTIAGSLTGQLA